MVYAALGQATEARPLLERDRLVDRPVFDLLERRHRKGSGLQRRPRLPQVGRAQQRANRVSAPAIRYGFHVIPRLVSVCTVIVGTYTSPVFGLNDIACQLCTPQGDGQNVIGPFS